VKVVAAPVTVKFIPLLATAATVTMTAPVVAPAGTGTTMLVAFQLVGVATVPLKVTVLLPCVDPKLEPLIVTEVPTGPDVGERLLMAGLVRAVMMIAVLDFMLLLLLVSGTTLFPSA
jgi:hypothetical protein